MPKCHSNTLIVVPHTNEDIKILFKEHVVYVVRGQEYCPLLRARPKRPDLKPASTDRRGTRRRTSYPKLFFVFGLRHVGVSASFSQ